MTTAVIHEPLDANAMDLLAGYGGPCLTISLPGFQGGAQHEASRKLGFHNATRAARKKLVAAGLTREADALLEPIEHAVRETEESAPAILFRAPQIFASFDSAGRLPEQVVLASHFYLTPFLEEAFSPRNFYILGLSKKHLRLFEYSNDRCRDLALPARVPSSLEEFGAFDQPDHDLENRSAAGPGTGHMRGVLFGMSSDREAEGEHLKHFWAIVDRELKPTLRGRPLLLMGVHEEIAAYRETARYVGIMETEIRGNAEALPLTEIATKAQEAAVDHHHRFGLRVLAQYHSIGDRRRAASDVHAILGAAANGRVQRLCVRGGTQLIGRLPPEMNRARLGAEDLINAAVVETLHAGGEVFLLPPDRMPETQPLAAILRY